MVEKDDFDNQSPEIIPPDTFNKHKPPQYGVPFSKSKNSVIDSLEFSQDVNEQGKFLFTITIIFRAEDI